jgi:NAD(P)H dehydrogenase (quinone)
LKIVITGATGKLGRMVVENLLTKLPPEQVSLSVRDEKKARDFEARGVTVRYGDFEDPKSLDKAFAGANTILLVSPNSVGEAAVQQHRAAIDAAKKSGATRVLYTSHMGSSPNSEFPPMQTHAAAESYLTDSKVHFSSMRNGFYADSATILLGDAVRTGELRMPEDGPVAWTAHADLAEVTSKLLQNGEMSGASASMTGGEALDFTQIAKIVSEFTGREVPKARAAVMLGMFRASRKGEFAKTDPTLKNILGRAPISMRDVLAKTLARSMM